MATATKKTAKTTAKKAAKSAAKAPAKKTGGTGRNFPASLNPVYNPAGSMTPAQQAAFPGAHVVFAVQLPRDNTTGPVVSTLVGPNLTPRLVDLTSGTSQGAVQLLPRTGEALQIAYPDGAMQICVSRPRWFWFGVPVTQG